MSVVGTTKDGAVPSPPAVAGGEGTELDQRVAASPRAAGTSGGVALERLRDRLRDLHRRAGEPSTRAISRELGPGVLSHATVGKVLRCDRVPSWGNLELVVEELHGDVEAVRSLWVAARDEQDRPEQDQCVPAAPERTAPERTAPVSGPATAVAPADAMLTRLRRAVVAAARARSRLGLLVTVVVSLLVAALPWHAFVGSVGSVGAGSALLAGGACAGMPAGASTAAVFSEDGTCFGYTDRGSGFGSDGSARILQMKIFERNQRLAASTSEPVTVIWLGQLTCSSSRPDGRCSDGRSFLAEREQLSALLLAQSAMSRDRPVRAVIANAGADMRQAIRVARSIANHRASFGARVAVVGGGESRAQTRAAIEILLDAGIPFISPDLTADLDSPGQPYVRQAGYLQLQPPNQQWAQAVLSFVARHTPPSSSRRVVVYHEPSPGDDYAESLARDMVAAARVTPRLAATSPLLVGDLSQLPVSVCRNEAAPGGRELPAAVLFADRSSRFRAFANTLTALCGAAGGPAMVVATDSVAGFIADDAARQSVTAPWPMTYLSSRTGCTELLAKSGQAPGGEASALLTAARAVFGQCDPYTRGPAAHLGADVALTWDAVTLATEITSPGGADVLKDTTLEGATGPLTVRAGQLVTTPVTPRPLCVPSVDLTAGNRSPDVCAAAFADPGG